MTLAYDSLREKRPTIADQRDRFTCGNVLAGMRDRLQLSLSFDSAAMRRDLLRLLETDWIDHYTNQNYDGTWRVLPFRSPAGARHPIQTIYSDPICTTFEDTPFLARCRYFQQVLAAFQCPLHAVRLMKLAPGSRIRAHADHDLSECETIRIHVPVTTNPSVDFRLNGERVFLNEGECWYLRLSDTHSVDNRGSTDRIHLVLDMQVTPWLKDRLREAESKADSAAEADETQSLLPRQSEIDRLRHRAGHDRLLEQRLGDVEDRDAFMGWIPFRIRPDRTSDSVDWCFVGKEKFTDPFFEQTIARCLRKPFRQLAARETPMDALLEWSAGRPGIAPTAFIFHGSRCGSTLLAQMAAALPRTVVISEAPPVDQVLRAQAPEDRRIQWLRALLGGLGQPRDGDEQHLFVKFDAWHVLSLDLVQRAFPGVPCVFLYREPAAVIASQQRMPGLHMVPGMIEAASIGIDEPGNFQLADEYAGRVLAAFYSAAASHAAMGRVTLMNYAQFPEAGVLRVLAWCGLADSVEARERLARVCQFHAKTPSLFYNATDGSTRPLPSARAREIAAQFVDPLYAQLEFMRRTAPTPG